MIFKGGIQTKSLRVKGLFKKYTFFFFCLYHCWKFYLYIYIYFLEQFIFRTSEICNVSATTIMHWFKGISGFISVTIVECMIEMKLSKCPAIMVDIRGPRRQGRPCAWVLMMEGDLESWQIARTTRADSRQPYNSQLSALYTQEVSLKGRRREAWSA